MKSSILSYFPFFPVGAVHALAVIIICSQGGGNGVAAHLVFVFHFCMWS